MAAAVLKLAEGEVLFVEGELNTDLFILKQGEIRIIKEKQGRLMVIRIIKKGDFVGEVSLFTGKKLQGATGVAITPCEIIKIPKSDIMAVLDSRPSWVFEVMKDLTEKLALTGQIMKEQSIHKDEVTRNIEILTPMMEGKYLNSIEDYRRKKGIFVQK
jgi:CRP/FNR family transcriptional regulator, anaerobic regulatory protein